MIDKEMVTGVVLAGGDTVHFGSDKALAIYNGKTFMQQSIEMLTPFCSQVVISGDRPEYNEYGCKIIPDVLFGLGPIGGIYSVLKASETDYALFLACDMPLVDEHIVKKLFCDRLPQEWPMWIQSSGDVHMLPTLLHKQLLPEIEKRIASGVISLWGHAMFGKRNFLFIPSQEERYFDTINIVADYDRIVKSF